MIKSCFVALALAGSLTAARAVVLLSEAFDYPAGSLGTASADKWTNHSGTLGELKVSSGRAFVTQNNSEDVGASLAGQPYAATTNVLLYAGFTINFTNPPAGAGGYFAHFKAAGSSGFGGKVFATMNGGLAGYYRVGISKASSSAFVTLTNNLSYNTDYTLIARYAPSNSASTLWLNPATENDPAAVATDGASAISVVAFALREALAGGDGVGGVFLDNLRVATSFNEVISSPPASPPLVTTQPVSQIATQGDNLTFTVTATGNPSPGYQWQFNGTNLAGATSTALVLLAVTTNQSGDYSVLVTNLAGTTNSQAATLTVNAPAMPPGAAAFSLLTYNVKGNGATDWTTNAPQVQAIARELQYLSPDIITFNEIPWDLKYEMTNFIAAFLPGYQFAISSGTDGFICSAIATRFSLLRSNKWLDGADLKPFGYTNTSTANADNFTRDLFEAEIAVPGFPQPLHVFTTHLKSSSGGYTEAALKRAAEAAAITNFFATNFFVRYPNHPYTLSGDLNEDNPNTLALQRLISAPMGLQLTNPTNPVSGSINTYNSTNPASRLDYIFPCERLASHLVQRQVFRTSNLNPVPPNLNPADDQVASDHLPVLLTFANPYDQPFRLRSISASNQFVTLQWETEAGRQYRVDNSSNLTTWSELAGNLLATNSTLTYRTNLPDGHSFFRVYRAP